MSLKHTRYRSIALLLFLYVLLSSTSLKAEDGYELWLRYDAIDHTAQASSVKNILSKIAIKDASKPTYKVIADELATAAKGMVGLTPKMASSHENDVTLMIGTPDDFAAFKTDIIIGALSKLSDDGFLIQYTEGDDNTLAVIGNTPVGAMYGTFHLLRLLQTEQELHRQLPIASSPKITNRILNHWDNLDRTVERGYAGFSIWDWHRLPGYIDQRYIDYARANASIGINGTVLTNVNANSLVLTPQYIEKVKALADVFRPYGIKVYLTARFSSPIEIGGLETADPRNEEVQAWWDAKTKEIYESIPNFGGYLVKANSEGQPGPQNYDRSHAEGANMLAQSLEPHGGIVMWRAFVYSHEAPDDRAKQANNEFEPLDGKFKDNVYVQVKNGAIDFQPREPFHPLFGAMPKTKLALELQLTLEYLGQGTNLVYLAPLFKECLESNTFRPNKQSTVASVIDGSDYDNDRSVIAAVSNIGNDRNWTGHVFGQSSWYAYGRLAWDHSLTSEAIAYEWIGLTFGNDPTLKATIADIMLDSRETFVNYSTPLGLHHIMGWDHHYGPGPWVTGGRPDWTSPYYHRADSLGVGFDRTPSGSNALNQYALEIQKKWGDLNTCPEKYLLWFHHVPWTYKMRSGNNLWNELCHHYDTGVKGVNSMISNWQQLEEKIDERRFREVSMLLNIQQDEARWWRNSCLLYFQEFSDMPFPKDIEQPNGSLEYYMNLKFPYAPGISPKW